MAASGLGTRCARLGRARAGWSVGVRAWAVESARVGKDRRRERGRGRAEACEQQVCMRVWQGVAAAQGVGRSRRAVSRPGVSRGPNGRRLRQQRRRRRLERRWSRWQPAGDVAGKTLESEGEHPPPSSEPLESAGESARNHAAPGCAANAFMCRCAYARRPFAHRRVLSAASFSTTHDLSSTPSAMRFRHR